MDGHLVLASSDSKIRGSMENFTLDAERWLAALYWCVRTSYGDDAAHAAADCWLRVFEERLEGSSDLPDLARITAAAIALFASRLVLTATGLGTHRAIQSDLFLRQVANNRLVGQVVAVTRLLRPTQ